MDNVRIIQSNPHSTTVQVYNAQMLIKRIHDTYYQVECNIVTAIGLVPCESGKGHLCWHSQLAMNKILNADRGVIDWFDRRGDAFWMWAGTSIPMSLVHVESKRAHGWAVVRGMVSGMELAALGCKGAKQC